VDNSGQKCAGIIMRPRHEGLWGLLGMFRLVVVVGPCGFIGLLVGWLIGSTDRRRRRERGTRLQCRHDPRPTIATNGRRRVETYYDVAGGTSSRHRRTLRDAIVDRRLFVLAVLASTPEALSAIHPRPAPAANLPRPMAGDVDDRSRIGTVETLVPIVRLRSSMGSILAEVNGAASRRESSGKTTASTIETLLETLPATERSFKAAFDRYSQAVSYKQRFLDQNAFLVYYTGGYDGPGRPSIEDDDALTRQTRQYGYRNDAWVAWEDFLVEIEYIASRAKGENQGDGGDDE